MSGKEVLKQILVLGVTGAIFSVPIIIAQDVISQGQQKKMDELAKQQQEAMNKMQAEILGNNDPNAQPASPASLAPAEPATPVTA
jgi:hypothetical protein